MYIPTRVQKLSDNQVNRLISGQGVRLNKGMGDVIYLSDQQIKKLERANKKGKGVTINFDPYQASQHRTLKQGGALGKAFKNLGRAVKQDVGSVGRTIKQDVGSTVGKSRRNLGKVFNKELGRDIVSGLEIAGQHAIEQGIPAAFSLGSMALGDPTGMSGAMLGNIASQYASDAYQKKIGNGLFKALHKAGIKNPKQKLFGALKDTAKNAAKMGSQVAGQAISQYTGNSQLGAQFSQMADTVAENAIEGNLKKGLKQAGKMGKEEAKRFAVEAVDDVIDRNLSGNQKAMAQNLLVGKFPNASDLVYDMADMYTGTNFKGRGMKTRGRPRKHGGALYPAGYKGGALGPA